MQKDVIYIDVEDDITAIIGKVKASKEKVVALVPPKRIGVLQSAVNLRLLGRAAKQVDKHLALVTNNQALIALASAASIPVARNLQSKPELAEIPALAVDDGEDVIEGAELPIGEHAKQAASTADEGKNAAMAAALAEAPNLNETPPKPKVKSGPKVPNFNRFRKRLIFGIGGAILLILFIIWATVIAPRATVVLHAKTSSLSVNQPIAVSTTAATSLNDNVIKGVSETQSDDKSVDFTPTGKKDAGSKATGTVKFSTNSISALGTTIPAGTKLQTSNGLTFTTDSSVTITTDNYNDAETGVTAIENGSKYNAADGAMSGAPNNISATLTGPTSGGVTKMITVVTAADVQNAKQQLADEKSDDIKNSLKGKFDSGVIVIDESFNVAYSNVKANPAVGEEGNSGTLTATVTYQLYGVSTDELGHYLDAYLKQELGGRDDQRVYDNGKDKAHFQEAVKAKNGAKATLIATAQVGPNIKDDKVKQEAEGKRFGEIQQSLQAIQGVEDVEVNFFPFWVNTVPNDPSRITVEFKLDESH